MFPPEIERVPGRDYSEGGKVYNLAIPITNMKEWSGYLISLFTIY